MNLARTRQAVILNLPWMVKKFLDLIFKFVDPVTKAKVGFPVHVADPGMTARGWLILRYGL
jgi:hypothetical protein